jgi:ribosomal protein S18 acetylase RimI-like enzyme
MPNRSDIVIRTATVADAELISSLARQTFDEAFTPTNDPVSMRDYMDAAFQPAVQAVELANPPNHFYLAEIDGAAAGYAMIRQGSIEPGISADRPIELVRLYALQAYLGRGIGPALMDHCLTEATRLGHDVIWLGVWEFNPRAQTFYRKYGFREVGTHVFQLGAEAQTDLLMQRPLIAEGVKG